MALPVFSNRRMSLKEDGRQAGEGSFWSLNVYISDRSRGGGNVEIGCFDFQGLWESRRLFHRPAFPPSSLPSLFYALSRKR